MSRRDTFYNKDDGQINIFYALPPEPIEKPVTMKCTESQKKAFQGYVKQQQVDASSFLRAAVAFYIEFHEHETQLLKWKKQIVSILETLP